jgi:hypothetical protein
MNFQRAARSTCAAAFVIGAGLALSGCFEVLQTVGIDRMGAGQYQVAVSAQGFVRPAIRTQKLVNKQNHAILSTTEDGGTTTRSALVPFNTLSDLSFSDETMSLTVKSRDLFGFGPAHVAYVADIMIDKARRENQQVAAADDAGAEMAHSILGDHTYTFTVSVPGSVEYAAPVTLGGATYQPTVTGDYFNHTVTWKIPLYALIGSPDARFEVDFWAWGLFSDARSQLVANN